MSHVSPAVAAGLLCALLRPAVCLRRRPHDRSAANLPGANASHRLRGIGVGFSEACSGSLALRLSATPRRGALSEVREATRAIVKGVRQQRSCSCSRRRFVTVGAFDVLAVILAVGVLDLGGSGAGYLTALYGAGAVLGTAASFWLVGRARIVPLLLPTTFAGGAVFVALGVAPSLVPALSAAVLAGISRGLLEVCAITLLQRATPTALLARMLAFKEGLTMAAWGLGSVLVPGLIALGGVSAALIGIGAIAPIVVLVRLRRLLRVDAAATVPVVAIALLRSSGSSAPSPHSSWKRSRAPASTAPSLPGRGSSRRESSPTAISRLPTERSRCRAAVAAWRRSAAATDSGRSDSFATSGAPPASRR